MLIILVMVGLSITASLEANSFGINVHVPNATVLDRVTEAGIGWVRIDFLWSLVEPEEDFYDWTMYDDVIAEIENRNLRILANFHGTPGWATDGDEFSGVPSDPEQVQEMVYLAAKRYRGRIHAWGLWNEPNLPRFWQGTRAEYIETVLLPGSAGIRAADADALVSAPDTAHLSSGNWDDWLDRVIRDAGHAIDVLTHHVYPSDGRAAEVTNDLVQDQRFPWEDLSVNEVLTRAGWTDRPFWLTETGVQSVEQGNVGQAEFYENLLVDWFGFNPEARWVDRVFFYEIHDPPDPTPWSFGILWSRPDLARKPSFYSYRDFIGGAVVDDAEIANLEVPGVVSPGELVAVPITFRNTGSSVWRGSRAYRLHIQSDSFWSIADPDVIPADRDVHPGDTVELVFRVQSPLFTPNSLRSVASFQLRIADGGGDPFGQPTTVTIVSSPVAPTEIVEHPRSVTVLEGRRAVFWVAAEASTELRYRWRRNSVPLNDGGPIAGSHSVRLMVDDVDIHQVGDYDCVIENAAGSVITEAAILATSEFTPMRSGSRRLLPGISGKFGGKRTKAVH